MSFVWFSVFIIIFMICGFIYMGLYLHQEWNNLGKAKRFWYFVMILGCIFNIYIYVDIIKVITGVEL